MQQNETSKPCRDHEIDRAFGSRDTSRVAIQPEDGIVALAEWVKGRPNNGARAFEQASRT